MEYGSYLQELGQAAEATAGKVVSLAGGYFGIQLLTDGANVVLALDLDGDQGWVTRAG
ncbi:hypothetical protein JD79_04112 [Geodermatophilus normandii]|uniref:Uncharacterized protein n=1 Tax=Geodermatophilus normandii TaxID=1137989 RepID=A0A317QT54_9ACTN|nr:hypothetical protein [Geodermatophilus normandii]PWW24920.1 hypothetical protein JD79_04112 [Geodermatophilus normandii]